MDPFLSLSCCAGEVVQSRGTSYAPSHEVARHSARALSLKHDWAVHHCSWSLCLRILREFLNVFVAIRTQNRIGGNRAYVRRSHHQALGKKAKPRSQPTQRSGHGARALSLNVRGYCTLAPLQCFDACGDAE